VRSPSEQTPEGPVATGDGSTEITNADRRSRARLWFDRAVPTVLVLTLIALALRLWHLQFQSLWWDEGVSIFLSGAGIRALTIGKDFSVDLHPPGYYLALAAWRIFLGPSVFSDRLFSAFCGTLAVPLTFRFVRRVVGSRSIERPDQSPLPAKAHEVEGIVAKGGDSARSAGETSAPGGQDGRAPAPSALPRRARSADVSHSSQLSVGEGGAPVLVPFVAALLVTISPIDVYYSQETRMYALLPVLGLISLFVTTRLLEVGKRRDWILWIVVNAVCLYTYYYLGLLTAAEALALLGPAVKRHQFVPWSLAQILTLVLYLPWAALMLRRLGGSALALPAATAVHLTPATYLLENWQDFTVGFTSPPGAQWLLVLIAVATLAGAFVLGRQSPALLTLMVLTTLVPLAGAGAVLLLRPFFYPRFILFAAIPIWTLAAIGLTAHRRLWPVSAILMLAILAGNGWTWYDERTTPRVGYAPDDYRVVFETLNASARPGDLVLCGYPWQAGYVEAYLWQSGLRTAFVPGRVDPNSLDRLIGSTGRAWVYEYSPDHRFAGNWLEQILGTRDRTLVVDQYGDSRVRLFAQSAAPTDTTVATAPPPRATLGQEIALQSSHVQTAMPARPGSLFQVTLRWRALAAPKGSYTVFVHLLGPDGKVFAQHDSPPLNGAFPTDRWSPGEILVDRYTLTIPRQAPPGTYVIEVGMYRPDNGQRLAVGPKPDKDNRIVIGEISVGR
jgi:mannosyltransferase